MTKQQALNAVASWWAASIQGATFEEAIGCSADTLSEADVAHYEWALEELVRRLYKMGTAT